MNKTETLLAQSAAEIVADLLANPYPHDLIAIRLKASKYASETAAMADMETYCTAEFAMKARADWQAAQDVAREWLSSQEQLRGSAARVLRLTLKKQWFDMIASGEKREEYRTPGKWILSRLEGKEYDRIEFKNGYGPNVPTIEIEYLGWKFSFGKREWGGGSTTGPFATIMLGRVLSRQNYEMRDRPTAD